MTLRIGCLGAARIAPTALTRPAQGIDEVEVAAIAARDRARAEAFAGKHGVGRVHDTYDALIDDPDIDAVYIPLPNGLHALWTLRALEAGKHVLCEKPFTANAAEAERVRDAANRTGLVVMEAFHWRYHPLAQQLIDIVRGGELGKIERVETWMCFPLPRRHDIRWDLGLAGGALMDAGCYAVHMLRHFAGAEPEVTSARAKLRAPGVDRYLQAQMQFTDGSTGQVTTSMWSSTVLRVAARIAGERGRIRALNPVAPQFPHRVVVKTGGKRRRIRGGKRSTYSYQLEAFAAAVRGGDTNLTPPADSVATMSVIDDCYRAAGLEPRTGATESDAAR